MGIFFFLSECCLARFVGKVTQQMDIVVPNQEGGPLKKGKTRHNLLISNEELMPLEEIDFLDPPTSSFYNTIEVPTGVSFWPDLSAHYEPYQQQEEGAAPAAAQHHQQQQHRQDTDDSSLSAGSDPSNPVQVYEDKDYHAVDAAARAQLQSLTDSEARWRETLQHLTEHYSPGTVLEEVQHLEERMRDDLTGINSLLEKSVLPVDDLFAVLSLKGRFESTLHQAEILEHEERFHQEEDEGQGEVGDVEDLVVLDWVDMPLAKSFKNKNRARATNRKKKGHCTVTAQLVCAPGVSFSPSSAVTAHFYQLEDDDVVLKAKKGKSRKRSTPTATAMVRAEELSDIQIQNNVEKMSRNNQVTFDLRFPAGTRNKPCHIRLHVKGVITLPDGSKSQPVEIVSVPSNHIIVTTNECQFETAELKLLLMELFSGGVQSCSWSRFLNALNVRWMRVTRQEADSGIAVMLQRALCASDFRFVAGFFRNAPVSVSRDEVMTFYSFFGKATHHYRHNLPFRQIMLEGLVWGFLSKDQSKEMLGAHPEGSFVIRASKSTPGSFCLSWKADSYGSVRHALLDVKLLAPPALAEFLLSKPSLRSVLVPHGDGPPRIRDKQDAFGNLLSLQSSRVAVKKEEDSGYVDLTTL